MITVRDEEIVEKLQKNLEFFKAVSVSYQEENIRLKKENAVLERQVSYYMDQASVEVKLLREKLRQWEEVKRIMGVDDE